MSKENMIPVWRYMSFSKFVWTIQNKSLWLSRADLLGDPWEISLSGQQLQFVIDRHPITPINEAPKENAEERAKRIIDLWRKNTFISCWNKSSHESNALWKIYCENTDGVVLQTTYEKLNKIKGAHSLHPVTYPIPGSNQSTPNHTDLVTKKRPMFSYEDEVRIIHYDKNNEDKGVKGIQLEFDFENLIESVRVHPEADESFFYTVENIIQNYAKNYSGNIAWSGMKLKPPF